EATDGDDAFAAQHNTPLQDIAQGLTERVTRNGTSPMTGNLPMGGFRVSNLGAAQNGNEAVRLDQIGPAVATSINAATEKATPADADLFGIADSAASFGLKKLTFANLKAFFNSLFIPKTQVFK